MGKGSDRRGNDGNGLGFCIKPEISPLGLSIGATKTFRGLGLGVLDPRAP